MQDATTMQPQEFLGFSLWRIRQSLLKVQVFRWGLPVLADDIVSKVSAQPVNSGKACPFAAGTLTPGLASAMRV
jgi:hypothetical protein